METNSDNDDLIQLVADVSLREPKPPIPILVLEGTLVMLNDMEMLGHRVQLMESIIHQVALNPTKECIVPPSRAYMKAVTKVCMEMQRTESIVAIFKQSPDYERWMEQLVKDVLLIRDEFDRILRLGT
jgi:hypothetical protein